MPYVNEPKKAYDCTPFNKGGGRSAEHQFVIAHLSIVQNINNKMANELGPLKERQDLITIYHKLLKEINVLGETDGQLDVAKFQKAVSDIKEDLEKKMNAEKLDLESKVKDNPKLQKQLDRLPEKYQPFFEFLEDASTSVIEIGKGAKMLTKEQRSRLEKNIEMDMEDLDTQNTRQTQIVSRLNNESLESYQAARLMLKTVHDAFTNAIQKWK